MTEDKVSKELHPTCGIQNKAKSKFSCPSSCGDDEVPIFNPNKLVVI